MKPKMFLNLALGILAAIGGFVDIGDLVFNTAAGATFGYQLMWVIPIGVLGIIVYSEMSGRVAAASGKAVFDAVRERTGFTAGLSALIASEVVNLLTLAAEIGGVAIALQLLSGLPYRVLLVLGVVGLALVLWIVKLEWMERIFGYGGLCMLVFAVAAVKLGPDWAQVGNGFIPHISQNNPWLYMYFAIGLLGAAMTPYEVYFYSSGGVEARWTPKDVGLNRANAIVGYSLGGLLSLALMIVGAAVFLRHAINPEHLGTIALGAEQPLGKIGLLLALVGILFAVGGASIDTVFSGAYNLAQFLGWEWGRYRNPAGAPRFALTWLVLLVFALAIVMTGVDPVMLTEYAVIFSAVALPLTYIPILLVANDPDYMGANKNGPVANTLGVIYLVVILVIAVAAIPLMLITNVGQN
ncbi:MAG TPA: Nramp family divalent metal transporter [Gaiellaceae bacterium]|nr:Nramp family divalent metal transporter [Gaiellaceae bacterium]